ncbi:MAG: gephyrin-like molybdotransferase Glp [Actinomycetes bacterium]
MRSVEEQLQLMLNSIIAVEPLDLPLLDARGTVLAEDVVAENPIPAVDMAGVDGFAVCARELANASAGSPVSLRIVGRLEAAQAESAGDSSVSVGDLEMPQGVAVRVAIGARIPVGADAVLSASSHPVTTSDGVEWLSVTEQVQSGTGVRGVGGDVAVGGVVVPEGAAIHEREFAGIVAAGRFRVRVHPHPRVVIVSSGDELVEAGQPLGARQVHDLNATTLVAAAIDAGAQAFRGRPVPDNPDRLAFVVLDQLIRADLVVVTGRAELVGDRFGGTVFEALNELGTVRFSSTAVDPGPVIGFGRVGSASVPIITIPSDPIAALIAFEVFVRPVIRLLSGREDLFRPVVRATLTRPLRAPMDIRRFVPAVLSLRGTQVSVEPLEDTGSLVGLQQANALAIVEEGVTDLQPGDRVAVIRLDRG